MILLQATFHHIPQLFVTDISARSRCGAELKTISFDLLDLVPTYVRHLIQNVDENVRVHSPQLIPVLNPNHFIGAAFNAENER